jgi:hypothetical protein
MFVQRGLIYRELDDHNRAAADLKRALRNYQLEPAMVVNARFWLMDSTAQARKQSGDVEGALAIYRGFLAAHPRHAEAWYRLGYMLLAEKRINEAGPALLVAIGIRPTTSAYLDAAGTFILTDAPRASELYRKGLDGIAARKPDETIPRPEEIERIKNEVVKADNSFRMVVGVSGITDRPLTAGGRSVDVGAEATVRFDGRYLPAVEGLEAYTRFYRGQDQTGFVETNADIGVRWRPFRDLDFYLSPAFLQRFQPDDKSQIALNWGLGLGGAAYPYEAELSKSAFDLYWDFAALGSYRTGDRRYLQDFIGNIGFTYGARHDYFKTSIGPTLLAVASFDSAADGQWALGAGPSVMGRLWFGGDQYRSYDALLQFQAGYVFAVGNVERQQGWRGKIILYY